MSRFSDDAHLHVPCGQVNTKLSQGLCVGIFALIDQKVLMRPMRPMRPIKVSQRRRRKARERERERERETETERQRESTCDEP